MGALGLRTSGRAKADLFAEIEDAISDADVASLQEERGVTAPQIVKLRERHHALARLIAEGKKPGEAALIARYSQSRVSILMNDPAFLELITHYKEEVNREFVDFQRKLAELGVDAATVLQERLEDAPDDMSDALLLRLVEVSADRTGHGPSSKTEVNVRVGLAERLQQARVRSEAAMRDITPPTAAIEGDE